MGATVLATQQQPFALGRHATFALSRQPVELVRHSAALKACPEIVYDGLPRPSIDRTFPTALARTTDRQVGKHAKLLKGLILYSAQLKSAFLFSRDPMGSALQRSGYDESTRSPLGRG